MATKKKSTSKVKTNVQIENDASQIIAGVSFEKLPQGHCFVHQNKFWMKPEDREGNQLAICLNDGSLETCMCGETVVPCSVYMDFESIDV